jgi:hypothetical protein
MLWYESGGFRNEITSKKGSYLTLSHETKTGRCSEWSIYYEQNWGKKYEYVLAFSADKVEDVTKRYTQRWETIEQRRHENNSNNSMKLTDNKPMQALP